MCVVGCVFSEVMMYVTWSFLLQSNFRCSCFRKRSESANCLFGAGCSRCGTAGAVDGGVEGVGKFEGR